jgi:hypothetical protein
VFLKQLSCMYNLEDPVKCLESDPPSKSQYKEHILTRITAFHEKEHRKEASTNSCMMYLNVSVSGLRGRHHPALSNMITTEEVKLGRCHIKMLCGDYLTYKKKSDQSGGSPHCRVCSNLDQEEDICHILTQCVPYSEIRSKKREEIENLCVTTKSNINFSEIVSDRSKLCQFILDPTSLNLNQRMSPSDPKLNELFKICRSLCNSINTVRWNILNNKKKTLTMSS